MYIYLVQKLIDQIQNCSYPLVGIGDGFNSDAIELDISIS